MKSVHKIASKNEIYRRFRCAAPNCAKSEKIWPRFDNFRRHCQRMHKDQNIDELVGKSTLSNGHATQDSAVEVASKPGDSLWVHPGKTSSSKKRNFNDFLEETSIQQTSELRANINMPSKDFEDGHSNATHRRLSSIDDGGDEYCEDKLEKEGINKDGHMKNQHEDDDTQATFERLMALYKPIPQVD